MREVAIIGAGPAGLSAAYKLCEYQMKPLVIEKEPFVGGLSRTINYDGCSFDIGPHRFFTKDRLVFNWWNGILKDDFVKKQRCSRIYYKGKFFKYPISLINVFLNLGILNSFPICYSYLKSRFFPYENEDSFARWVTNRFGDRLYRLFFKEYTEKIWGISCDQISADWAAQRIKGLSLSEALRNALPVGRKNAVKTLIREFYYPRKGAGMFYQSVADCIRQRGGSIKLACEVMAVKHNHNKIEGLVCRDIGEGRIFEIKGTDFCSSMPLPEFIARMDPPVGDSILRMCKRLKFRSLLVVFVILKKRESFKDHWLYVHSPELRVGRVDNFKNWSLDMVNDPDKTPLGLEYFCSEGDSLWCQSDQQVTALAKAELEKLKIAENSDVSDTFVLRIPNVYPLYDLNYQEPLQVIKDFICRFSNLYCIGRGGMFRYNNMDHSILTGFLAARNILGAKLDIWDVNIEKSYHEELEDNISLYAQ